ADGNPVQSGDPPVAVDVPVLDIPSAVFSKGLQRAVCNFLVIYEKTLGNKTPGLVNGMPYPREPRGGRIIGFFDGNHLVGGIGEVRHALDPHPVCEIIVVDQPAVNSPSLGFPDVGEHVGFQAQRGGGDPAGKDIPSVFGKIIGFQGEFIEQAQFQTQVHFVGNFPGNLVILVSVYRNAGTEIVEIRAGRVAPRIVIQIDQRQVKEAVEFVGDPVVPVLAVGGFEFQQADYRF